ncbi:MAG: acylphosphatase [Gammaproteobacteria bacterium]|nr:acylphosphatase [Gammaproteobacteria bacterium]
MICYRYLISGRVQGVFYRASAQHQASALGLRGWVRNLVDGRVELLACGDQKALDELEKWLKIGPEYAKVSNIEIIKENQKALSGNFEVRPTSSL